MKSDKAILTAAEVSEWLRIPISTLYKLCRNKQIPCAKVGRHWRFDKGKIHTWFQKQLKVKQVKNSRKGDITKIGSEKFQKELLKGLSAILESTPFGILLVGEDKKIRLVNREFLTLMNATSEKELINNIGSTHPDESILQDKGRTDWSEINLIPYNGKPVPVLRRVVPITIGKEKVVLEMLMEISDFHQGKVDPITVKEKSEEIEKAKRELFSNLSHKLRTPLGHIIGFTEIIVDKDCGNLNDVQEEYLNDSLKSAYHLLDLINHMLDYSKSETV
jgi:excisionase family DNA binding protein